jgi:hypothetical protein
MLGKLRAMIVLTPWEHGVSGTMEERGSADTGADSGCSSVSLAGTHSVMSAGLQFGESVAPRSALLYLKAFAFTFFPPMKRPLVDRA